MQVQDIPQPPVVVAWYFELSQEFAYPGYVIGSVYAVDPDVGDIVSYSVQPPGLAASQLTLDPDLGTITIAGDGEQFESLRIDWNGITG